MYYRACIWGAGEPYTGPTHVFTMPDYDVPAIDLTNDWTDLTENTFYMFKFTATEAGFYGVDAEGLDDCVLLAESFHIYLIGSNKLYGTDAEER